MTAVSIQVQQDLNGYVAIIRDFEISNVDQFNLAGEALKDIERIRKALEKEEDVLLAPVKAQSKAVKDVFKPFLDRCKDVSQGFRAMMGVYQQRQIETQRKAMLEAQRAAEARSVTESPAKVMEALQAVKEAAPVKVEGVSIREVWEWQIDVPDAVPRELCSPDEKKIGAWLKTYNGGAVPAGIVVRRGTRTVVRT